MTTANSKIRRLSRFLGNPAVRVREWYAPVARRLVSDVASRGLTIRLIMDGTSIGFGHQLLMVAIAYRRRATPLSWGPSWRPESHNKHTFNWYILWG